MDLELAEGLTVLLGPNATGKTNVVEALQLMTAGRSFRNPAPETLVKHGSDEALVVLSVNQDDVAAEIKLRVSGGRRRVYEINGTPVRSASDVQGRLSSVVFTPDDLNMIKRASDVRRAGVDEVGEQVSKAYSATKKEYGRLLRQRNVLLKTDGDADLIDVATEQLVRSGARLTASRARLAERIAHLAVGLYAEISGGENLEIRFVPSWERAGLDEEVDPSSEESTSCALVESLALVATEERARGTSLVGPHRDDLAFTIEGRDARDFASQGQQRSIALAWKLAEVEVMEEITHQRPLLLLDDVMSELDEGRRNRLAATVQGGIQTVMTTTNLEYFDESIIRKASIVDLGNVPS